MPNIELNDYDENPISLNSIDNKIILVEFWASWCKPCRIKHKELNRIYELYKDAKFNNADGFEIYYVSLDNDKRAWEMAIQKDGIANWKYHVVDLAGMKKSPIPEQFQFEKVPSSFLIDSKGIIIGKDVSDDRLFHELKYRLSAQ